MKDGLVVTIFLCLCVLCGFGLSKAFDSTGLNASSLWPIIFLILIGVVSWFVYQVNVDGFSLKKAKNDQKVAQFRADLRVIDVARQIEEKK